MQNINRFKTKYLQKLSSIKSFSDSWVVWGPAMKKILPKNPSGSDILELGDHLGDIFQQNSTKPIYWQPMPILKL